MDKQNILDGISKRLALVLDQKGLSFREAGRLAGGGPSYISGIINEGKDPQVSYMITFCENTNTNLAWLLYGVETSKENEKILKALQDQPHKRDAILALLAGT